MNPKTLGASYAPKFPANAVPIAAPGEQTMKNVLPMLVTCLLLSAAMAHGAQQASPASSEHSAPSTQQDSQPASMASSANRGDKVVSGCLRSKDGKYMLESKHHNTIWLTGSEDLAPHVGHSVTVHGSFMSSTEASPAGQVSDFQVKQIDMVADRCTQTQKAK
jgi:hypothetical protein